MGVVPVRPQAREAVADALKKKVHWAYVEIVSELADDAIQAFLAAEETKVERQAAYKGIDNDYPELIRLCGPWRRVDE
jgi:hypothetical protein